MVSYNQRLKTKQLRENTAYVQVLNIIIKCSNSDLTCITIKRFESNNNVQHSVYNFWQQQQDMMNIIS